MTDDTKRLVKIARAAAMEEAAAKAESMGDLYGAYATRRLEIAKASEPRPTTGETRRLLGEADEFARDCLTLKDAARVLRALKDETPG